MTLKLWELLALLAIIILVFGPGRIAGLGGAVGKAMKDFREAVHEEPKAPTPDKGAGGKS
jgi:sec-independent protein translocase protein TatA